MQSGTILLTIEVEDGTRLPGAIATVTSPSLEGSRTVVSNAEGEARIALLPPGDYELTVTMMGFKTVRESNIMVGIDSVVRRTVVMVPESVEEGL